MDRVPKQETGELQLVEDGTSPVPQGVNNCHCESSPHGRFDKVVPRLLHPRYEHVYTITVTTVSPQSSPQARIRVHNHRHHHFIPYTQSTPPRCRLQPTVQTHTCKRSHHHHSVPRLYDHLRPTVGTLDVYVHTHRYPVTQDTCENVVVSPRLQVLVYVRQFHFPPPTPTHPRVVVPEQKT